VSPTASSSDTANSLPPEEWDDYEDELAHRLGEPHYGGALMSIGRTPDGQTIWADRRDELKPHLDSVAAEEHDARPADGEPRVAEDN